MKDPAFLLSALIACAIHALLLFLNIGMTRPDLASAISSIEVSLVGPPQAAIGEASEAMPSDDPAAKAEPETMEIVKAPIEIEPVPVPKPLPEPVPEPEPEPVTMSEPDPIFEPEPAQEPEIQLESSGKEARAELQPVAEPIMTEIHGDEPAGFPSGGASGDEAESSGQSEYFTATVDRSPAYTYNPKPAYPRAARRRGQEGTVLLLVEVLPTGRAGKIEIERSSGFELLDTAAVEAVQGWRFLPAKRGMRAVRAWVKIPVEFNLRD